MTQNLRIPCFVRGKQITIRVNEIPVTAYEGESVHAALTAAGIYLLRQTGSGEARGAFCGMGLCYECLVTVNHIPDQRACMTLVQDGMKIRTHD
ncbi:MAG: (2Fe-2S)-binding protein [Desulfobacteraceae bacterium]|nr:(2Fe-2S)-binding protein [Desulfobacteraceae bacterium]